MMGQIIKLKKSKLELVMTSVVLICVAFAATSEPARAQGAKLPVIQQVGVIPVQWDKQTADNFQLEQSRQAYQEAAGAAAREARRFRILNDDLVSALWSDAKGRQELQQNFELHAYLNIGSQNRGETIDITARLLDANLKTLLLETDTFSASWFLQANKSALKERAESLVFRLFNRIPVDVSVTSIQGQYVTLSGGQEQGIEPGDSVDLERTLIQGLHPANGSWLTFSKRPVGKARVIDVKKFSSVARLTQLVTDNSVEVGDGARIPAIATRVKFARQNTAPEITDNGPRQTIVVPPLYPSQPQSPIVSAPAPRKEPESTPPKLAKNEISEDSNEQQIPPPAQPQQQDEEDDGPSLWKTVSNDATSHKLLDQITAYTGPYWWNFRGPASSSGKFPVWLLNSLGVQVSRTLLFKIKTDFGGGIVFGNTPHGSYTGYQFLGSMYWEDNLYVANGFIRKWRGGGVASFSGMSVPKGPYGGGDSVRGGGFVGLMGAFAASGQEVYDWYLDYALLPLNIGRSGYRGKQYNVESSLGMRFALGAFQSQTNNNTLTFGAGLEISDERVTLSNGTRPHIQDWHLKVMARYKL